MKNQLDKKAEDEVVRKYGESLEEDFRKKRISVLDREAWKYRILLAIIAFLTLIIFTLIMECK